MWGLYLLSLDYSDTQQYDGEPLTVLLLNIGAGAYP